MEVTIQIFLALLGIYAAIGVLFAIYFFVKGAFLLDELVATSKWTIRLLLIPGAFGLWPILMGKIIQKKKTSA